MTASVKQIFNFGRKAETPFAPSWNYFIGEGFIEFDITNLKKEIISKEKEIINLYEYVSDWGTKLGKDSLTARSANYNLLNFNNAMSLRAAIKKFHDQFVDAIERPKKDDIYVQCWANVMRKKQKIAPHIHNATPACYLSGHLCVQVNKTATYYVNPFTEEPWKSENSDGKMTIFPSWVKHYTDAVSDDKLRITLAFDIIGEKELNEYVKEERKSHWVKL